MITLRSQLLAYSDKRVANLMLHATCYWLIAICCFFSTTSFALDTSVDTGSSRKSAGEIAVSFKSHREERESSGDKTNQSTSRGGDSTTSDSIRSAGSTSSSGSAKAVQSLEVVFLSRIMDLERDGVEPFSSCLITTQPKTVDAFGLTPSIGPDTIDVLKADYLSKAAVARKPISEIGDENAIRAYRDCLLYYGAVIGQSYVYLTSDIKSLKASVNKTSEGNIAVAGIGQKDFELLADGALARSVTEGFTNEKIAHMFNRALDDNSACIFDGAVDNLLCGNTSIHITGKPSLYIANAQWYGEKFAGYSGSWELSRNWSLTESIEHAKNDSRYSKFATEVAQYTDNLESTGKTRDASFVRKKAFDLMKSGRQVASPSQWLNALHQ